MSNFNTDANWRYATKKFDATKKVSAEDLATLKEAIRLSASSYGLQPYQIIIVENPETREQLKPVSWGQTQITDASHLLVFASITDFGDAQVDAFIKNVIETRGIPAEAVQAYADLIKTNLSAKSLEDRNNWTAKQAYIALGNLLNAAAELKIDVTPMEGFSPDDYDRILGLPALGLHATLVAAVGYRHEEDATQHYVKVRKSNQDLFITL